MKTLYKSLIAVLMIFSATACEEFLDVSPDLGLDGDEVYSNYESFRGVIDRAYYTVHNYAFDQMDWDSEVGAIGDEAQTASFDKPTVYGLNAGLWQDYNGREINFKFSEGGTERHWDREPAGEAVRGIRIANLALENLELLENYPEITGFTPEQLKDQLEGEARILRAWHYFQIIQRYGGIFYMNKSFKSSDLVDSTRHSYAKCTDWMVSDLNKAIDLLPANLPSDQHGRATKTSARAIKSMALLYAASPNMNVFDGGGATYIQTRAEEAAAASLETIASANASGFYKLYDLAEYTDNWWRTNSGISYEALWLPPMSPVTSPSGTSIHGIGWWLPGFDGGWGPTISAPTQNHVDCYETAEGYAIQDAPPSSYDPQNPYENRDPRLDMFIWKNGDDMYIGEGPNGGGQKRKYLESWKGSWHYDYLSAKGVWTGYLHKKHRWPGANTTDKVGGYFRTFPLIRLAQVYLDFAEAANEAYGPSTPVSAGGLTMTAVEAVNVVRQRVGMPDVLGQYTGSKEAFRERIRNERAVELYQEAHRWPDIRRWRIADDVLDNIYAVEILKTDDTFTYGKRLIERARVFEEKHYWYPFPSSEMNNVVNFSQNPGW